VSVNVFERESLRELQTGIDTHTRTYTQAHIHTHARTLTQTYTKTRKHTHTRTQQMHTCTRSSSTAQHTQEAGRRLPHAEKQDCVQAHTHIYIHIHADIHIHIRTYEYASKHTCVHTHVDFSTHHTQGAGRHLLQAGQAVEDALRHARQLILGQIKATVGMADMS